jgi:hypothetical protein
MRWRWFVLAAILLRADAAVAQDTPAAPHAPVAQDGVTALPDVYRKQFENDWVRVVRIHYAPNVKLAAHSHPARPAAYVYLNESGPVVFRHVGSDLGSPTRPSTKTGAVRLSRGMAEVHEVENLSDLPSDFLRVEFKTEAKEARTMRGKFFRETASPDEGLEKVQFENAQIRVTRLVIAAGRQIEMRTTAQEPALLIMLTAGNLESTTSEVTTSAAATSDRAGGRASAGPVKPGQERWVGVDATQRLRNGGPDPVELLRFDLKTAPSGAR